MPKNETRRRKSFLKRKLLRSLVTIKTLFNCTKLLPYFSYLKNEFQRMLPLELFIQFKFSIEHNNSSSDFDSSTIKPLHRNPYLCGLRQQSLLLLDVHHLSHFCDPLQRATHSQSSLRSSCQLCGLCICAYVHDLLLFIIAHHNWPCSVRTVVHGHRGYLGSHKVLERIFSTLDCSL